MRPVIALALKDLRHLIRDRGAFFFAIGFPLLVAVFFGLIFGGNAADRGRLTVAVCNQDSGDAGASFVTDLKGDDALEILEVREPLAAHDLVRTGKAVALLVVPSTFTQDGSSLFSGGRLKVSVVVDPSHHAESGLLTGKIMEIGFRQLARIFTEPKLMDQSLTNARRSLAESKSLSLADRLVLNTLFDAVEKTTVARLGPASPSSVDRGGASQGAWSPVEVAVSDLPVVRGGPRSGYEVSFTQGIIWGLMGCVTAFGSSLASERARGTLARLTVAPVSRGQVLAGKALACFIACIVVQAMLIAFGMAVFGVRVGSPAMMVAACLAGAVGFTGVMMFIAGMSRTEGSGAGMGRALVLVLAMIGGGTVPLFVLPSYMLTVSRISPFSWATTCIEGAMWRGFTPAEMALPVGILVAFGSLGFVIGVSTLRWGD